MAFREKTFALDQSAAGNGLTVDTAGKVGLGGALTKPTTLTVSAAAPLSIVGLPAGVATDQLLSVDATGKLRLVAAGATVAETAAGTVDITAGASSGNAVRALPELSPIGGTVDQADLVVLYDQSTGKHVSATVSQLAPATTNTLTFTAGQFTSTVNGTAANLPIPAGTPVSSKFVAVDAAGNLITGTPATAQVLFGQSSDPNVTPPAGAPFAEASWFMQTVDGTATGARMAQWLFDSQSGKWVNVAMPSSPVSVSGTSRTYYPNRSTYVDWLPAGTAITAAALTAYGFTAVGGAVVADYTLGFNGYRLIRMNATVATAATMFTVPTQYVRHTVPADTTKAVTYHLKTLGDRWSVPEVWICDPATGVPAKRIEAKSSHLSGTQYANTATVAPDNAAAFIGGTWEWTAFNLSAAEAATYKTASGGLTFAIRPGLNNQEATLMYLAGWAVTDNPFGFNGYPALAWHWAYNGGAAWTWYGAWESAGLCSIAANATLTPNWLQIPNISKDVWLTFEIANGQASFDVEFTINHPSGAVPLGRPSIFMRPPREPMSGGTMDGTRASLIIPASVLATKTQARTNATGAWLSLSAANRSLNIGYLRAITVESV